MDEVRQRLRDEIFAAFEVTEQDIVEFDPSYLKARNEANALEGRYRQYVAQRYGEIAGELSAMLPEDMILAYDETERDG